MSSHLKFAMNAAIWRAPAALILAVLIALLAAQTVYADTIVVTTTDDVVDGTDCAGLAIGDLPGPDGVTSLREAVCAANNTSGMDEITLAANTYSLTIAGAGEDDNASGDLDILDDLSIVGAGGASTIVRNGLGDTNTRGDGDRIFHVDPGGVLAGGGISVTLTIDGLTVRDGDVGCDTASCATGAAAIDNEGNGDLTIRNSQIISNTRSCTGDGCGDASDSGALRSVGLGSMFVMTTTIADNLATCADDDCDAGGGVIMLDVQTAPFQLDKFLLQNSVIRDNRAECMGDRCAVQRMVYVNRDILTLRIEDSQVVRNLIQCTGFGCDTDEILDLDVADSGVGAITESVINENILHCTGQSCDTDEIFEFEGRGNKDLTDVSLDYNQLTCSGIGCDTDEVVDASANMTRVSLSYNRLHCDGDGCDTDEVLDSSSGTKTRLTVNGNQSTCSGDGCDVDPAINSGGDLIDSVITNNVLGCSGTDCRFRGGALGGRTALTVTGSLIANNIITGFGGGVMVGQIVESGTASNEMTIVNSTISGNRATEGGGIYVTDKSNLTLINVTITDNKATNGEGSGIYSAIRVVDIIDPGQIELTNTIIADQRSGQDCDNVEGEDGKFAFVSNGHNLDSDGSCNLTHGSDWPNNPNADLGPLQDNGGPTDTHALSFNSAALNTGNTSVCTSSPVDSVDQRDVTRPQGPECDIGAFELDGGTITIVKEADPTDGTDFTFATTLLTDTFSLDDSIPDDFDNITDTRTFIVVGGVYTFTEILPAGWGFTGIECELVGSNGTPWTIDGQSVEITVGYLDDVICTFNNRQRGQVTVTKESDPAGEIAGDDAFHIWVRSVVTRTWTGSLRQAVNGLAVDDNDNVYVGSNKHEIVKYDSRLNSSLAWGESGSGAGQFDRPTDIAAFGDNIYVMDGDNQRVQQFDTDGTFIRMWGWGVTGSNQFEECTANCQAGTAGGNAGQFQSSSNGRYRPGIATDAAGNVYVADTDNHRVQQFDGSGNFIRMWGWGVSSGASQFEKCTSGCQSGLAGDGSGQFDEPAGIAVDKANGIVYVGEKRNDRVQRFDTTGNYLGEFAPGTLTDPRLLAVDADGDVYVASLDSLSIFDSAGVLETQIGAPYGQINSPQGLDVDSTGTIFLADFETSIDTRVQRFTPIQLDDGQSATISDLPGSSVRVFETLDDDWYLADVQCSATGTTLRNGGEIIGVELTLLDGADIDCTLTNAQFGSITAAKETDPAGGEAFDFSFDGPAQTFAYLTQWGATGSAEGEFDLPTGSAVDAAGNLYVVEKVNHRVQKFDAAGTFLRTWGWGVATGADQFEICTDTCGEGIEGSGNGQFDNPLYIAVDDTAGRLYVTDEDNDRVQVFDLNGNYLMQWGVNGAQSGEFDDPEGIAIDSAGNVYVVDSGNYRVQKFDSDGNFLRMWGWGVAISATQFEVCAAPGTCQQGARGDGAGQFYSPVGIAVNVDNEVFVNDLYRLIKFSAEGAYLRTWGWGVLTGAEQFEICEAGPCLGGIPGDGVGQFKRTNGLGIDGAGVIYVPESETRRVNMYTSDGAYVGAWGRYGLGDGEWISPREIAISDAGLAYVTDRETDQIKVFALPPTSFTLGDDDDLSFLRLPSGAYEVSETDLPDGWSFDSLVCEGADYEKDGPSALVGLDTGEEATCTFTNVQDAVEEGEIIITESFLVSSVDEGFGKACYWINSTTDPGDGSITIDIGPSLFGEVKINKQQVVLDSSNWDSQTTANRSNFVCVTAVDDQIDEPDGQICKPYNSDMLGNGGTAGEECGDHDDFIPHSISATDAPGYSTSTPIYIKPELAEPDDEIQVLIRDNDTAGVAITESFAVSDMDEDGDPVARACYWITLTSAPLNDVTVHVTADGVEVATDKNSVTLTTANWNSIDPAESGNKVCVLPIDEGDVDTRDEHCFIGSSAPEGQPGDGIEVCGTHLGRVDHTVTSNDPTYHNLEADPANFDGNGYNPDNDRRTVNVLVRDDEEAQVKFAPLEINAVEGSTASYDLWLTAKPTGDVTVRTSTGLVQSHDAADGLVDGIENVTAHVTENATENVVSFTPENWDQPQTMTIEIVDDQRATGPQTQAIEHRVESSDVNFNGIQPPPVLLTVVDDDAPGVIVTRNSLAVAEGGGGDFYTLRLTTAPSFDVTIQIVGDGQVAAANSTLIFTPQNWQTEQVVPVIALDDVVDESSAGESHHGRLTHLLSSADRAYDRLVVGELPVLISDNDQAGVTVSQPTSTTLTEGGAGVSYQVTLDTEPQANVAVYIATDGQSHATPARLIFDASNWRTPQIITVTAVDDAWDEEASHAAMVHHAVTGEDERYAGLVVDAIEFVVEDNDRAGVHITPAQLGVPDDETRGYSVVLATQPRTPIVLDLLPDHDLLVDAACDVHDEGGPCLLFTTVNWQTPQVVNVTRPANVLRALIQHEISSGEAGYLTVAVETVTVTPEGSGIRSVFLPVIMK